jgi:uncharacterized protein (TIGR00255 family)
MEIRALNHKHQDVRVRVPSDWGEEASFIEQMARAGLGRGRYDIGLREEGDPGAEPGFNMERVRSLFLSLQEIHQQLGLPERPRLDSILTLPSVLVSKNADRDARHEAIRKAFESAGQALAQMRAAEGAALRADLEKRLEHLTALTDSIAHSAQDLVVHHRQKLRTRIEQLLVDVGGLGPTALHAERLEQEIALLADRSDITEELVRLRSHLAQFAELSGQTVPVGRRLDFLLQEMSREVNTIGSKSQHAPVAHLVVEMKSEVERLREQVQNVT